MAVSSLSSLQNWMGMLWSFAPGLLAAVFYGISSGSMSFMNKVVLTSFNYNYPDILMLGQLIITTVVLEILRLLKLCNLQPWSYERAQEFFIPSICFALHTTSALAALGHLSIPMYNVIRRLLPLASLGMAHYVLKKSPSRSVAISVLLVVAGCILAGLGDVQFNMTAYIYGLVSVCAQALYLTYVQKTGVEKGISALSVLHINSINCIPFLVAFVFISGSAFKISSFEQNKNPVFWVAFLLDISMGCVLNYSLFLCATMNSALTTSLVGVVKSVLTTVIGFFTFGGVPITVLTVSGVSLNTFGGLCYTYAKYLEKKEILSKMSASLLPTTLKDVKNQSETSVEKDQDKNGFVEIAPHSDDRTHA